MYRILLDWRWLANCCLGLVLTLGGLVGFAMAATDEAHAAWNGSSPVNGPNPVEAGGMAPKPMAMRHPISIVEANIFVQKNRLIMKLKCFADDLELLQGVSPLDDGSYDPEELKDATADHAEFLAERVEIFDAQGRKLEAKIIEALPPEIPETGLKMGDLMAVFCNFHFEYSYDAEPEFITINSKMLGEGYLLPSELQVLLKQAGSDTPYRKLMKPESPETFRFDWTNPVLGSDATPEQWESWFEEQRQATLGITSYSSVYSFIYITNFEVRHEILIPLASLATMIDFERADESFLDIDEQDAAKQQIIDFFSVDNEVLIDSIPVSPVFDRIDFYGLDLRDFAMQAERRKISMANGRIGVILSYSAKAPPTEVKVEWKVFNDAIQTIDSVVIAYDQVSQTQFSRFLANNVYVWNSPERPPLPEITQVELKPRLFPIGTLVLSGLGVVGLLLGIWKRSWLIATVGLLLCGGAFGAQGHWRYPVPYSLAVFGLDLPESEASSIFQSLHQNVFRAFDYRLESDVYDALANSVSGPLLRDLYLQINQRLVMQDQGGASARIDQVEFIEGSLSDAKSSSTYPGFNYRCKWNLVGTVEHWGHIHQRTNQYEALFRVDLIDNQWKITEMAGLNEEQISVNTSLRKF